VLVVGNSLLTQFDHSTHYFNAGNLGLSGLSAFIDYYISCIDVCQTWTRDQDILMNQ